jgi:hypothetical protein
MLPLLSLISAGSFIVTGSCHIYVLVRVADVVVVIRRQNSVLTVCVICMFCASYFTTARESENTTDHY